MSLMFWPERLLSIIIQFIVTLFFRKISMEPLLLVLLARNITNVALGEMELIQFVQIYLETRFNQYLYAGSLRWLKKTLKEML